ncbi:hypothetical protein Fmac_017341 [Flemingia macrophylla]|uniref:Uncharacterized protein n=1 Tax=Flemingia macrophylla TaxID=520843 RepID=A0ABD1M1U8_9FABA
MASIYKLLSLLLFLSVVFQGDATCSPFEPQGVTIVQTKTGKMINDSPEWNVAITNDCRCSQSQVKLFCKGFQPEKVVNPSILQVFGGVCLLNKGNILHPSDSLEFLYASAFKFPFFLVSSEVTC